ncbi:MAG: hypothetical protein KAG37_03660 [Flavobacteriales bacterium]|nr:hypothetical protein [Flavobacteriales bacterium]
MKLRKLIPLAVLLFGFTYTLKAQKASEIKSNQIGENHVQVHFDLSGAKFNETIDVELFVSFGGGELEGPLSLIDYNDGEFSNAKYKQIGLSNGKNSVIWDVYADVRDLSKLNKGIVFTVKPLMVTQKKKKHFFIQYSASALITNINYITPIGVRLGVIGGTGFYLAGYYNTMDLAMYDYYGEAIEEDLDYEVTGENLYPRMSITGGLTFQMSWSTHFFIGAGFSTNKYYKEIMVTDYYGTTYEWVNIVDADEIGAEVELGFIFSGKWVNWSIGASTYNFQHFGANLGIGLTF